MKKLFALLLLSGSLNAFASPFVEEDFVPVAESGYGCYVFDDTGKQIMVADATNSLHFDQQAFAPQGKTILPNRGRFAQPVRYHSSKNVVIFHAMTAQKLSEQDQQNGVINKVIGQFEYRKNGRTVYRGKFTMQCAV